MDQGKDTCISEVMIHAESGLCKESGYRSWNQG